MCYSALPEIKPCDRLITSVNTQNFDLFYRYSSLTKLQRITTYCLQFIFNLKVAACKINVPKQIGKLSPCEVKNRTYVLVKIVQNKIFFSEIKALRSLKSVIPSSKLSCSNPFLDDREIIRVGGKLANSQFSYDGKHPAVLRNNHPFIHLAVLYERERSMHSGYQATLSHVRQNFWPLHSRRNTKAVLRKYIPCFKAKPVSLSEQMGEHPIARVTPSCVF